MLKTGATALVAVVSLLAPMSASPQRLPAREADPMSAPGTPRRFHLRRSALPSAPTVTGVTRSTSSSRTRRSCTTSRSPSSPKCAFTEQTGSRSRSSCSGSGDRAEAVIRRRRSWAVHVPSGGRVTTEGVDPPTDRWITTYGYTVTGTQLKLRFIKFVQPGESEKQRLACQKQFIMYAAAVQEGRPVGSSSRARHIRG